MAAVVVLMRSRSAKKNARLSSNHVAGRPLKPGGLLSGLVHVHAHWDVVLSYYTELCHRCAARAPSPRSAWFPGAPPTRAQIEELESICYWIRQLIALVCGLACGVTSTQGAPAFVVFGSLHMILSAGVLRSSAAANGASTERRWALVQEGLTASVGTFLVTWTLAWGRSVG